MAVVAAVREAAGVEEAAEAVGGSWTTIGREAAPSATGRDSLCLWLLLLLRFVCSRHSKAGSFLIPYILSFCAPVLRSRSIFWPAPGVRNAAGSFFFCQPLDF